MPIYGIPFTFTDYQHFNYMQLTANPHIYGNDKPNAQSVIIAKIVSFFVKREMSNFQFKKKIYLILIFLTILYKVFL